MEESIDVLISLLGISMVFELLLILASQTRGAMVQYLEEKKALDDKSAIEYSSEIKNRFFLALMFPRSTKFITFTKDDHIFLGAPHVGELNKKIYSQLLFGLYTLITSIVIFTVLIAVKFVIYFN